MAKPLAVDRTATRVLRGAGAAREAEPPVPATPEARMEAVWELTLQCRAFQGMDDVEPRLQRSAVRVQRTPR